MSWKRLESGTVDAELLESAEARIADPMWLLGRQWQVGEFKGEDAASPVLLEAKLEHAPIGRVRLGPPRGGGPIVERGSAGIPLETLVEREPIRSGPAALRLAADAGLQLWRFLATARAPATLVPAIRKAFPLKLGADDGLDPVGRAELALLARRSCDARAVYDDHTLRAGAKLKLLPGMQDANVATAVRDWATWYGALYSEPAGAKRAWNPRRMEYRFQVAAGVSRSAEVQLDAREYTGGHLDWYAFDRATGAPDMGTRGDLEPHDLCVIPTPARFAGQAASRWWQVENEAVWFGDLGSAPEDLAHVAVGAFGMLFGDDWYLAPVRLPSGVIARGTSVTVFDTYGETHDIASCAANDGPGRDWRFFELTGDASADAAKPTARTCPWLLLPPALPGVTQSKPVEEVALLRDEVANLGWAAELRIESAAARTIDRAARARARAALAPTPELRGDAWRYLLVPSVPEHMVPLVPVTAPDGLCLQRGRLAVDVEGDDVETRGALGRILEPEGPLLLHDDEVPATGAHVTRAWQLARSGNGGVVLWMGRRKSAGRPLRSPGLVYDEVARE